MKIGPQWRPVGAVKKRKQKQKNEARSLPYLEVKVGSRTWLRTPSFAAIGSGVSLPGVAENPTFPIFRALAYTRPTCDLKYSRNKLQVNNNRQKITIK